MPGIASGAEMRPGARSIRQAPSSRQEAPLQQNSMIAGAAISAFDQPLRPSHGPAAQHTFYQVKKKSPKSSAEYEIPAYEKPSKSAMKREMTSRQVLGQELVDLPKDALARVPLPEDLEAAVLEARSISDFEGRRRQMQYIGKLMRQVDPAPIEAAMDEIRGVSHAATQRLHQLEQWRERLLKDEAALETFADRYVHDAVVIGELRSQIRLAKKEREAAKPPRHQRALFQQLRVLIEASDDAADEADDA
jgi:ribosome-associated protein